MLGEERYAPSRIAWCTVERWRMSDKTKRLSRSVTGSSVRSSLDSMTRARFSSLDIEFQIERCDRASERRTSVFRTLASALRALAVKRRLAMIPAVSMSENQFVANHVDIATHPSRKSPVWIEGEDYDEQVDSAS